MATGNLQRLSQLFTDPVLRAAFERAEWDNGDHAAAVIAPEPKRLDGAAARVLEFA